MQRQFDPSASSAALAAAQYWKEQQAESMQGKRIVPTSRISLAWPGIWCTPAYSQSLPQELLLAAVVKAPYRQNRQDPGMQLPKIHA